ncbi:MAG TPA: tRNA 2-thiouridine(34) synthase MnmA, partial [Candidatus Saccharibacteria bacterium]|nr:tRNA 2-thiouridine(34) synthase MnmA [Candidatus Saccharibacteria bacterium]
HGLDIGGGLPYYVVGKDMKKNEVYVTTNLNDKELWREEIVLASPHWINGAPKNGEYQVRVRHRAALVPADITVEGKDKVTVRLHNAQRAVASGQSIVVYSNDMVLGGGIVTPA